MPGYDHYAEARDIARQLRAVDLIELANEIEEAMTGGSTGTEIFMRLGSILPRATKSKRVTAKARNGLERLMREINGALSR